MGIRDEETHNYTTWRAKSVIRDMCRVLSTALKLEIIFFLLTLRGVGYIQSN